jgi:hypothetical protein
MARAPSKAGFLAGVALSLKGHAHGLGKRQPAPL